MNTNFGKILAVAVVGASVVGCETTPELVNQKADDGHTTLALDYRDFNQAANDAIDGMIASGNLNRPGGGRYVLMISRIKNDTVANIDTDQLVKKIRVALMQKGKVVVSTAVGVNGPEDQATALVQGEFGGNGVAKPELSLSGKIIGRSVRYDSSTQQVEYYLQLTLTDIKGGYSIWEGETPIVKRGSSKTVAW